MKYDDTLVLVFARAPIAGKVNTRLIPSIGIDAATRLQQDLIHRRLSLLTQSQLCNVTLMCAPDTTHPCFKQCKTLYNVSLVTQSGSDLGQRMSKGIQQALEKKPHVIVVGTDTPALSVDIIDEAITQLRQSVEVVLVPAEDGGYVLIGVRQNRHALFEDIQWGSELVMQQTRDKIKQLGLHHYEMKSCWDIDRVEDYRRFLQLD